MAAINYATIDACLAAAGQQATWAAFATQIGLAMREFEAQAKAQWVVNSISGTVTGTAPPPSGILKLCKLTGGTIL